MDEKKNSKRVRGCAKSLSEIDIPTEKIERFYLLQKLAEDKPADYNRNDPDMLKAQCNYYFEVCNRLGVPPGNMGLYLYCGIDRREVPRFIAKNNTCSDILKDACQKISTFREYAALSGEIRDSVAIFMMKNYDNMTDTQKIEIDNGNNADTIPIEKLIQSAQDLPKLDE